MQQARHDRQRGRALLAVAAFATLAVVLAVPRADAAPDPIDDDVSARNVPGEIELATKAYVEEFWPLWMTNEQFDLAGDNKLIGPDKISPVYQLVVAINDDTLYGSGFVDLYTGPGNTVDPVIVTVPAAASDLSYSVLTLDMFGDVMQGGIPSKSAGTASEETVYALVPEGYGGALPPGSVKIEMSVDFFVLIFRTDRYTDGVDRTEQAAQFRAATRLLTLSEYNIDPSGGATDIVPEAYYGVAIKTAADTLVQSVPVGYLVQLQAAVKSNTTPPLSAREMAIAATFDALFGDGGSNVTPLNSLAFSRGARTAHDALIENYLDNVDDNYWIHFTNIGDWANDAALDRASIAEFLQYGNDISTAAYYHAFKDADGVALTGDGGNGYVLTFPPNEQPPNERFWSLTAYTPNAIELIDNPIDKYLVGSYTPGLEENPDGSLSIYISETQPAGVPQANWLPVSDREFNVMLRIYGVPENSTVSNNTYRPPPVERQTSLTMLPESERFLDTRNGSRTIDGRANGMGPIPAGTSIEVPIEGRGGIPSSGVEAVIMNATAVNAAADGYITTYPCDDRPVASSLNYSIANSAVANELIAKLSADGSICIYAHATTDLVLDAVGYVATTSTYTSLTSARVLDTRPGQETVDGQSAGGGPIPAGTTVEVPILGRGGVPSSGVDTVVVNATATDGDERGFITVYPCDGRPLASSLNYAAGGSAVANEVIAKLSPDGTVCAYAHTTTNLIFDVVGYFPTTPTYTSQQPARVLETRRGQNTVDGQFAGGGPIAAGTSIEVSMLGRGGIPTSDVDTVVLNATATDGDERGFVTIYPCGDLPLASSLNYPAGGTAVANEVIARLSPDGTVCAYAHTTTNLILDAVGHIPST